MKKRKAIILHGWNGKPESNWFPWLKRELEKKNYAAYLPQIPTMETDMPDMNKQLEFISKLTDINRDTIIFGHSLGCLLAMRLAEKYQYQKMFIVAGWDFDDLTEGHKLFWPNKINHAQIKRHVKEIYVIHSNNDPYITACQAEDMSKRFGAKFILVKNAGHFSEKCGGIKEIPELKLYI